MWQGFCWIASVPPGMWPDFKEDFLEACRQHLKLRDASSTLYQFFTFAVLDSTEPISVGETGEVLQVFNNDGRQEVAATLHRYLQGAEGKGSSLWVNRVKPRLVQIWPKEAACKSPGTSIQLAKAVLETGTEFEQAATDIEKLLIPSPDFSGLIHLLIEKPFPDTAPKATLNLLEKVISTECRWPGKKLRKILDRITSSWPEAIEQRGFKILDEYLQRHDL